MEANELSTADYIRNKLDSKEEVSVEKTDNGAVMTAYAYAQEETSFGSIDNRDAIQCKWTDENGVEWNDIFNIYAFERPRNA